MAEHTGKLEFLIRIVPCFKNAVNSRKASNGKNAVNSRKASNSRTASNSMFERNSRNANNSRNESNNRIANTVWTLTKNMKPATALRGATAAETIVTSTQRQQHKGDRNNSITISRDANSTV